MEIKKSSQIKSQEHKIQLVDGEFTPIQALDIISALIRQKIDFHKLEGIQNWERNHSFDHEPMNNRIKELENTLKQSQDFILEIKDSGKKLKIDGVLKISLIE